MKCVVCGKQPSEIDEYVVLAKQEKITPDRFVRGDEGTYNRFDDIFCCTECYCRIGMPSGVAQHDWIFFL